MNGLLKSLACSGTECFCWILVLFNILAVFYLVFCSFWKVSVLVKIFGWLHAGVLVCVAIGTLFYHTCIYTLLATIFTGMMLMAILSIILLPQEKHITQPTPGNVQPNRGKHPTKRSNACLIAAFLSLGMLWVVHQTSRKHDDF